MSAKLFIRVDSFMLGNNIALLFYGDTVVSLILILMWASIITFKLRRGWYE